MIQKKRPGRSRMAWFAILLVTPLLLPAQRMRTVEPIICRAGTHSAHTFVPPPPFPAGARSERGSAIFDFTFVSVPADVEDAIRFAADIWSNILVSDIPIRVEVSWANLPGNTLASSGPTLVFQSFELPDPDIWYPIALAESILRRELNEEDEFDIRIILNRNMDWYRQTDGRPSQEEIDLVTVILHELTHGLGFFDTSDTNEDGEGLFGIQDRPIIFDAFLIDGDSNTLIDTRFFPNPSIQLLEAFESDNLFFSDLNTNVANDGAPARIYAPSTYNKGSSLSHLDEDTYPPGSPNSLMSPNVALGEVIHSPGPVTRAIMEAIGWNQEAPPPVERTNVFLSPNPASANLRVELPAEWQGPDLEVELWDMSGRLLSREQRAASTFLELEVGRLNPGIYVLRLQRDGMRTSSRFAVVK